MTIEIRNNATVTPVEIRANASHGAYTTVSDIPFGPSWNGDTAVAPSKNALFDQLSQYGRVIDNFAALATTTIAIGEMVFVKGYATVGDGGHGLFKGAASGLLSAHPRLVSATATAGIEARLVLEDGGANVDRAGAKGDGTTNDSPTIIATYEYVKAVGGGVVDFSGSKSYLFGASVPVGHDIIWRGNGAEMKVANQIIGFVNGYDPVGGLVTTVTADVLGNTNQLAVAELSGITVGNVYSFPLAYNPYDNVEPVWAQPARVLSKSAASGAGTITIDTVITKTLYLNQAWNYFGTSVPAVGAPSANGSKRGVYAMSGGWNVLIEGFTFNGATAANQSPEGVIYVWGVYNFTVRDFTANLSGDGDAGAGLFVCQWGRNVLIDNPKLHCNRNGRNQASLGRAFTFSNTENFTINRPYVRAIKGPFVFAESFATGRIVSPHIEIDTTLPTGAAMFFSGQGSTISVEDPTVYTNGIVDWNWHDSGGTVGECHTSGVVTIRGWLPRALQPGPFLLDYNNPAAHVTDGTISNGSGGAGNTMTTSPVNATIPLGGYVHCVGVAPGCRITANLGGGSYTVSGTAVNLTTRPLRVEEFALVDYRRTKDVKVVVDLKSGVYDGYTLEGPIYDVQFLASTDAALASCNGIYVGFGSNNGNNYKSQFVAGSIVYETSQQRSIIGNFANGIEKIVGASYVLIDHGTANTGYVGVIAKMGTVLRTSCTGITPPTVLGANAINYGADKNLELIAFGRSLDFRIGSTSEVLTGTSAIKTVTPDALAALWEKGTDVASAGTVTLGEGGSFTITGTTTITDIDFAVDKAGRSAWLVFAGAVTLTHSSTLILPSGANITTAAGDVMRVLSEGSDIIRCVAYQPASGLPVRRSRLCSLSLTGTALAANEVLGALTPPSGETWTFAANFAGASGLKLSGGTNPAASYAIDVKKNGTTVGTITISTAGAVSFATSGATSFSLIGGTDELQFVGPASAGTALGFAFAIPASY